MRLSRLDVHPADWRVAAGLATGTVLFGALIQLESYVLYARGGSVSADAAFVLALPFLQLDALVLGALFGVAYLLVKGRWLRLGLVAVALLANAWPIVNQIAYGILRQNVGVFDPDIALGTLIADAPQLAGSAAFAAGWLTVVNVLVLAAGAVWVLRRGRLRGEQPVTRAVQLPVTPLLGAAAAYVAISFQVPRMIDTQGLERHAVVALLTPVATGAAFLSSDPSLPDSLLHRLAFGTVKSDASDAVLSDVIARARSLHRPNVLLLVLESVGADQLFPRGAVDSLLTPNVARLARNGVLFPNVYSVNPSTTLAHVPMVTGGPVITWGDATYFSHPYTGATLPGELRTMGYRTGLFAATDLGFGKLERFYRQLPWDTLLHYGNGNGPLAASQRVHAWGVNEGHLWTHARRWVEAAGPGVRAGQARTPFFLNFQTISTHYPYGAPSEFRGPFAATDARSRYLNALAYTDAVLGRLLADLDSRGELERTIVVITGDHGEAFADKHPQNMAHRNYVYDENMRSFLLFAVPGLGGPIVSPRVGTHGDLMPSLLALLGATPAVSGQNLFAAGFAPRPVYFHKGIPPGLWGLRDGQWKFIDRMAGGSPELYDLDRDADEHTNLAAQHADMIAVYRSLVNAWYVRANYDFLSRLGGFELTDVRAAREHTLRRGLRDVRVGVVSSAASSDFTEMAVLQRTVRPTIDVRWFWLDRETSVRVRLVSPSRRFWVYPLVIDQPWSSTIATAPLTTQEPGRWTVDVWSGARKLGRTVFDVP